MQVISGGGGTGMFIGDGCKRFNYPTHDLVNAFLMHKIDNIRKQTL